MSSEQFNYNDMFLNGPDGSELGLGWEELPPTFMGATSSFGQQPPVNNHGFPPQPPHNYGQMNTQMNTRPMIPPSTSADVLEAATVLQNGSAGRSHSMGDGTLFGVHDMLQQPMNGVGRSQSTSQYPPPPRQNHGLPQQSHGLPQRALGESFYRHNYYHDMVFGADPEEAMRRRHAAQKNVEIQWGSDTRFASPHSFGADHQDRMAASERSHLQMVDNAFRLDMSNINSSAENTQPSSPVNTRTKSNTLINEDDEDSRPRKRRKSKYEEGSDEEDDVKPKASSSKQNGKKRKPAKKIKEDDSPAAETTEQSNKRRKSAAASAAAAAKATRENLTEDQKRENHIKSEQKRRSLIKEGFDDLNELVPGLRGGGFSKSAVLIMTADWLENILQGNEELKARLEEMEGS